MSRYVIVEGNSNDKDNVRVIMVKGERGYSAYELYRQHGGTHSEAQWLDEFLNAENFYNKSESVAVFNRVADMKAYNLRAGDTAITLGYYSVNDGGGADYKIVNDNSLINDNGGIIDLTNGLKAILISKQITPKMFGAKDSENIDQSTYIQNAINYCFNNNIKEINLNGKYFVNNVLEFEEKENLKICNGTVYVHETNELIETEFNIFDFTNCFNIIIDNVNFIETNPTPRNRKLYCGSVIFRSSTNCQIRNCYFENTMNGPIIHSGCDSCIVENNSIKVKYHSSQFAQSGILNYAAKNTIIKNNRIIGEFYDGMLSVYGGGCFNVLVDGNKLNNKYDDDIITLSEGITIDASPIGTIVTNNVVENMYYGIDNKNDTRDTMISNNILIGNKISIADRPGEEGKNTYNCIIHDNDIKIQKNFDTDKLGKTLFNGCFFVGIYINEKYSCDVKNNKIHVFDSLTGLTVGGIQAKMIDGNNIYTQPFSIQGNEISFATGFGSTTSQAGSDSMAIRLNSIKKGIISNNSFKVDNLSNNYNFIELHGNCKNLLITGNLAHMTSNTNHYFIRNIDNSEHNNIQIYGNYLNNLTQKAIDNLMDITNIYQNTKNSEISHRIVPVELINNVWKTVAKFKLQYSGQLNIRVQSLISSSGNKYFDGKYNISLSDLNCNVIEMYKYNNGLEVQFINSGENNECLMQVKSNSNISNFSHLYITELLFDQRLTMSNE